MSNKNLIALRPKVHTNSHSSFRAGSPLSRRFAKGTLTTLVAGMMLASGMAAPANAALSQTGPVDPVHGFPTWYSDQNGLQLELCLESALCLAALPDPSLPVSFPGNFPDEAFWWAADASIESGGISASLVMAQEAAFTNEVAEAGQQTAFSRLRIRVSGLVAGAVYTITHPYGTVTLTADPTGVINYTADYGCFDTPCNQTTYDRALNGPIPGPFLQWDEGAPTGYIGDPEVEHTVTGSPTGNNFFQIEGPGIGGEGVNSLKTDLFAVQGKILGSTVPDPTPTPVDPPDPVDEEPVDDAPVDDVPVDDAPVGDVPVDDAPVGDVPVDDAPVGDVPVDDAPVGDVPVDDAPVGDVPVDDAPVGDVPVDDAPVDTPVVDVPADEVAEEAAKAAEKAAKDAAKVAEETAKAQEKATKDAAKAMEETVKAQEKATKDAAKVAEETAKAQEKASKDAAKAAERAAKDAAKATADAARVAA